MSSSKIIKRVSLDSTVEISAFSFNSIGSLGAASSTPLSTGSFVPMALFQGVDQQDSSEEVEEVEDFGPPPVVLSEDELSQKISESFDAGLKEGKDLAERGLINVFRALRSSSEAIHNLRDKILRESEDELLKLIMIVARKVILREVAQDRTILTGIVQHALAGLSAREEITVRINPDDYLLVTAGRDELLRNELLNDRLLLKPDPSVSAGFCVVDTAMGTVDASLDSQMDQIYQSLLDQRTAAAIEPL